MLAHAGALRIDHAMSLYRLFWIAHGFTAADGAYVRYPFADLVRTVAEVSQARQAIVIGEDLGIVPEGFRDAMHAADIQSYRVLFFEKRDDHFLPAERLSARGARLHHHPRHPDARRLVERARPRWFAPASA